MLRRRPVMRTMARTAVIAGTASAVAGGVSRHQQQKYAAQDAAAEPQYVEAAPAAPAGEQPAPAAPAGDTPPAGQTPPAGEPK